MDHDTIKELADIYKTIDTPEDTGRFALFIAIVFDMSADQAMLTVNGYRTYVNENDVEN